MPTPIHAKVRLANLGQYPQAVIRLKSGWVMLGEVQPLPGYCLLFSDPVVPSLNSLDESQRIQYSLDAIRVGDALLSVAGALRINYETWGNLDPALHTHIVPRYKTEPDELRVLPACKAYDWKLAKPFNLKEDGDLMARLKEFLKPYSV